MKQKIIVIILCGLGIIAVLTLLIWSICDIGNILSGIEQIKNVPEVWGSNPDLSYNFAILREAIIKASLALVSLVTFVLLEIHNFKPFLLLKKDDN